jgi:hypothetical protein
LRRADWILLLSLCWLGTGLCLAEVAHAGDPDDTSRLQADLDKLDAWIGPGAKGDKWRGFLRSEELRNQMAAGADADLDTVAGVVQQYHSGVAGLELSRFAAVRRDLDQWFQSLIEHSSEDLANLAWTLRGEHRPMTDQRFAAVRQQLRDRARELERSLRAGKREARWKEYLHWELLDPHLQDDVAINRESLENLDAVLRRFHSNQEGLEKPAFTRMARAIERYRELAFWNALARRRDTGAIYDSYVKRFQEQMQRHLEAPTVETERQIGKSLGMIEYQGQAPALLSAIRSRYSQPNVLADVSVDALNDMAEPICQMRPVRDCILGASVRGTALTSGDVTLTSYESPDQITLDILLTGHITTNTLGYRKPVRVSTTGHTNYTATKRLTISDREFLATPAWASAQTRNHTNSIRKTGGKFGRRLIEKIAWKKVSQKKGQSERIAAQKTRRRISEGFDEQVLEALTRGRVNYEGKFRLPLVRRGFKPEEMHFASTSGVLTARMALTSVRQISTDALPPAKNPGNEITVQVHETAINNFLPFLLSGVGMSQLAADEPQQLEGDVPDWLKKAAAERKELEPPPPAEAVEERSDEEFKPYRLEFNNEQPVSVSFDDGRLTLRLRFATLYPNLNEEEPPLENWDFVVVYQVDQRDGEIVLKRVGDIEVFPTGFDPRWDTKLTNEQVGYRNNLAKNINKRAARGEGFPAEIVIPRLELAAEQPQQREFHLQQLDCDDGWLTVGYQVL